MTDRLREAAEVALDAMDDIATDGRFAAMPESRTTEFDAARDNLRAALAEPEVEPVAWMVYTEDGKSVYVTDNPADIKVEQRALPLYTHPPRREWQGLTNEERKDIREHQELLEELGPVWAPMLLYYYLAIEAALKEKNT
jgi:hypothetical protein